MGAQQRLTHVLCGTNRRGTILAVVIGPLLGGSAWVAYPILGVAYWPLPHSVLEWLFVVGFVLLTAGITSLRAGFLAVWWVTIPAHVAMSHYVYAPGFVVLPFRNDILSVLMIGAAVAFGYGIVGYLLGQAGRYATDRTAG